MSTLSPESGTSSPDNVDVCASSAADARARPNVRSIAASFSCTTCGQPKAMHHPTCPAPDNATVFIRHAESGLFTSRLSGAERRYWIEMSDDNLAFAYDDGERTPITAGITREDARGLLAKGKWETFDPTELPAVTGNARPTPPASRVVAESQAQARPTLTDDVIDALLWKLNEIALEANSWDLGLPITPDSTIYTEERAKMRAAVRAAFNA